MYSNWELRAIARKSLSGAWGMAVLVVLLYAIIATAIGSIPFFGGIVGILVAGPLIFGLCAYFLRTVRGERPDLPVMFSGFQQFGSTLVLYIVSSILIFLWTLLLIIPGIIASLRYSMAYFIMHDNPGISALDAIRASKEMMHGYKGKLFLLMLSFIGWAILCVITFGIGYLWLGPYVYTSLAAFYEDLRSRHQFTPGGMADPYHPSAPM